MIVFSDFDDTIFLHHNPEGTRRNYTAVKKFHQQGYKFCIATGRSFPSLQRAWPDVTNSTDYLLLDNGAVCAKPNGKEIFSYTIPLPTATRIDHWVRQQIPNPEICPVFYYNMCEHPNLAQPVTKIRYWVKNRAVATQIPPELLDQFGGQVKSFAAGDVIPPNLSWYKTGLDCFFDIMSNEAGKENAITRLSALVAPGEQIITIGDSTNDNDMLAAFNGYAVENATPDTLAVVQPNHIVPTIADLLENLIGEK